MTDQLWIGARAAEAAAAVIASLPVGWGLSVLARRFKGAAHLSGLVLVTGSVIVTAAALFAWLSTTAPVSTLLVDLGLGWTLLVLAAIDVAALRLPDVITGPLALCGLLFAGHGPASLAERFAGLALGVGVIATLDLIYMRLRGRTGVGLGDAKLFGAAGAWLGWRALPSVLLIACAGALVLVAVRVLARGRSAGAEAIPFGAPLCIALATLWFLQG